MSLSENSRYLKIDTYIVRTITKARISYKYTYICKKLVSLKYPNDMIRLATFWRTFFYYSDKENRLEQSGF